MADNVMKVILDLDNVEFVKKLKESIGLVGELGETDSLEGLTGTLSAIGAVAGVVAVGVLAVKAAIDFTEEAEHIKMVQNSFDSLAKSAGLAGDEIKSKLVHATHGLADDTDILQAANRAIIEMGTNAAKIPQTMELARKYTAAFGGDLIQNFEGLNRALATGSERMLRQYGIVINNDTAIKNYAKSIGVGVEFLTDAAKKQAVMNEALEVAKTKFQGIDETVSGTTQNMKKMSVSWAEIKEAAILAWDKVMGPTVTNATNKLAEGFHNLAVQVKASFGSGQEAADAQKEILENRSKELEKIIAFNKQVGVETETYTIELSKVRDQLDKIGKSEEHNMQLAMKKQAAGQGEAETPTVAAAPQIDYEKLKQAQLKFEKEIEAIRMKRAEADLQYSTSTEQAEIAFKEKSLAMTKEAELQKQTLKKEGLDKGIIDQKQYADAVANINATLADKLKFQEQDLEQARLKALENSAKASTNASQGFARGWAVESKKAQIAVNQFGNLGTVAFTSIKKNAVSAFEALGNGSKTASEAMKGFVLGAIADMAQSQGEFLLASGIGTVNPIQIAEGGALIALASALRAKSGAGGGSSSGGGASSGGGGGGASSQSVGGGAPEAPAVQAAQQKHVTFNISGNIMQTDQTKMHFMELMRQATDATDFSYKQVGQP